MSTNYVKGCYTLIYNENNIGKIDNSVEKDINYQLLKKLYEANEENNLDKYIELYTEYIGNKNIWNFHTYTDHPPSSCTRVFYPYCNCLNRNEDGLEKIHRGRWEQSCNCEGGKRYLALRNAYEIELKKKLNNESSMFTFSIADLFEYFNLNPEDFAKSQIIKYIESTGPVDIQYTEWIWPNE